MQSVKIELSNSVHRLVRSIKKLFKSTSVRDPYIKTEAENNRIWQLRKKRTILMLLLLIILFFFNRYHQYFLPTEFSSNEHLISFFLININMIITLIVGYLLLRNIIKIIYERKKRVFGYKLKLKLIVGFLTVSIIPTIFYYTTAQGLLQANFNRWFNDKLNTAVVGSENIITAYKSLLSEELKHYSLLLAKENAGAIKDYKLNEKFFNYKLFEYQLNGLILYDEALTPLSRWFDKESSRNVWLPVKTEQFNFQGYLQPQFIKEVSGKSELNRAVVPLKIDDNSYYLEAIRIDSEYGKKLFPTIKETLTTFLGLTALEPLVSNAFNIYLLLLTMAIIFGCIWFALYLAKSITDPIDHLVNVTGNIAANQFNVRLPPVTNDEIGKLTQAFQDMTEKLKHNQEELKKAGENLVIANDELTQRTHFIETVLNNIHYGIISFDLQGYVLSANQPLIDMLSIKKPTFTGQHFSNYIPVKYAQTLKEMQQNMISGKKNMESRDIYGDIKGQLKHIQLRLFVLKDETGQHMGMLAVFHDITEIDYSTRTRAWQEVARRIAHEIKNPLTPIQLSAQHIRNKFLDKKEYDIPLLSKSMNTIIQKVDMLKNIVNEFDNFARIPEIKLQKINLEHLVDQVIEFYKIGTSKGITIRKTLHTPLPDIVLDPEHINRALTNLVKNSIEAIQIYQQDNPDHEGMINICLTYEAEMQRVLIDVIDNGNGISLADPQSIFEPYVTAKKHGTGLGLTIVRRIISDHDGFIRYEPNIPNGSIIKIQLPIKQP